jgi:hypothetical protein
MNFLDIEKLNVSAINDGDIELTEIKFLFVESRKWRSGRYWLN